MITAFVAAVALLQPATPAAPDAAKPVLLGRVFQKGQKFAYDVKSNLQVEQRQYGLETFLPSDLDINYGFTMEVQQMKADGIAQVLYLRPTMTQITGETYESPPKTQVIKTNYKLQADVSPINELLNTKDLNPPKPAPAKPGALWLRTLSSQDAAGIPVIGNYIQELYRLALFIGTLDSGMDFSPKMPYDEVAPGATWKRTVGYQPQRTAATGGNTAVQRLDYTFQYDGVAEADGKPVHRITATLKLDTDAAPMLNELVPGGESTTGLKKVELKLEAKIVFDLDLKTMHTLGARAESTGGIKVFITPLGNEPYLEERLKGRTSLRLLSLK